MQAAGPAVGDLEGDLEGDGRLTAVYKEVGLSLEKL